MTPEEIDTFTSNFMDIQRISKLPKILAILQKFPNLMHQITQETIDLYPAILNTHPELKELYPRLPKQ